MKYACVAAVAVMILLFAGLALWDASRVGGGGGEGGHKAVVETTKPKHVWPDTDPIDKTKPHWEFNNNLTVNGIAYKKEEIESGRWQWVENKAAMELKYRRETRKAELFMALQTRVVSDAEMAEALEYGDSINIRDMTPYYEADKRHERADAFVTQARLRAATAPTEHK